MARKPAPAAPGRVVPEAPDPRHRWDRPVQAPGHMQVDFEERVDFRRLHDYRLARVRRARENQRDKVRAQSQVTDRFGCHVYFPASHSKYTPRHCARYPPKLSE